MGSETQKATPRQQESLIPALPLFFFHFLPSGSLLQSQRKEVEPGGVNPNLCVRSDPHVMAT